MENLRTCKICEQELTDKDMDDLRRQQLGDREVEAKHWKCFLLARIEEVDGIS